MKPSGTSLGITMRVAAHGLALATACATFACSQPASDTEYVPSGQTYGAMTSADNDLKFTYDSPNVPWPSDLLASVQTWLPTCYPHVRDIFGPPASPDTINVRYDPALDVGDAHYDSATKEIVVKNARADIVCHELVHAFRGDYVLGISAWEEGMARAVEIEVMKRSGLSGGSAPDHSYISDVYYEQANQPCVGVTDPWPIAAAGWDHKALRYSLAGYAWAKPMLEDYSFYQNFNLAYYAQVKTNPFLKRDEAALIGIASQAKATVQDQPFAEWYAAQNILDIHPPAGNFVYIEPGGDQSFIAIKTFSRDADGIETNQPSVSVQWTLADDTGAVLFSGTGVTDSFSKLWVMNDGHTLGRQKFTATATFGATQTTSTTYLVPGAYGVVGAVVGAQTGSVTLTPEDQSVSPVTVPVTNGAFVSTALYSVKGRIRYWFTDSSGASTAPATITKDDDSYYIQIDATKDVIPPTAPANLTWSHDGTTVSLSWQPSTDNVGVTGYDLYYGSSYLGTFTQTTQALIGFKPGVPYTLMVKARDAAGNVSQPSNQVTVLLPIPQDTTPPTVPTNLTATSVTSNSIRVSWTASIDDVGVVVYQVLVNGNVAATVTSPMAIISGLAPSTLYTITAQALDAAGNKSPASAPLAVTTSP